MCSSDLKKLHIRVENPSGKETGCAKLTVNGEELPGNYVPAEALTENTEIVLTM